MSTDSTTSFKVRKDDWATCQFDTSGVAELQSGEVLFRVDRFALTANNITYAAAGDMLNYWGFFPATDGWGRIPAMGFADVVESKHSDVAVGGRYFGFFPMATHLVVEPTQVSAAQFVDGVAHRKDHAPVYRQYQNVTADGAYDAEFEDQIMVLRGLFMTSFLADSYMADQNFGAKTYVLGSASSKTGIALAWLLHTQQRGRVVGVTSERNRSFVEALGYYDEVLTYDDIKSLPANEATAFIDFSGDGEMIDTLHHHLGDNLKYHGVIGATHWSAGPQSKDLPGAEPAFFFAPGEIKNRIEAWGPDGFQQRMSTAWREFCAASGNWMKIERGNGTAAVERVYQQVLAGESVPSVGHVLSLWDGA
jgi:hypothetical protein